MSHVNTLTLSLQQILFQCHSFLQLQPESPSRVHLAESYSQIANDSEIPMDARKDHVDYSLKYTIMMYPSLVSMIKYVFAKISILDVQHRTSSYFLTRV